MSGATRHARTTGWFCICWAAVGTTLPGSTARATDPAPAPGVVPLPAPSSAAWRPVTLRGVSNETRYTPLEESASTPPGAVHAESDCSASLLVLPLDNIDLATTPRLRWRWRIDRALDVPAESSAAGDDFAARVYVAFALDSERASLLERTRSALAAVFYGTPLPGSALNYVWTRRIPRGRHWANPHSPTSHMIALARGGVGTWRAEEVDVRSDYYRSFGHEPTRLIGVGVMSDSDNSCQRSAASFADFAFVAAPGSAPEATPRAKTDGSRNPPPSAASKPTW